MDFLLQGKRERSLMQLSSLIRLPANYIYLAIFTVIYYLAANAGAAFFSLQPKSITLIWLPSGIGLIMMMKWGWYAIPCIFIAGFGFSFPLLYADNTLSNALFDTFILTCADLISASLGMMLLQRFLKQGIREAKDLFVFFISTCLIPLILSSAIISLTLVNGGYIAKTELFAMVKQLFLGDSLGVILVYLTYVSWKNTPEPLAAGCRWFKYTVVLIISLLASSIFYQPWAIYLLCPVLIASAFESNQFKVSIVGSLTLLTIIVASAHDLGPFSSTAHVDAYTHMIAFVFATALSLFGVSLQNSQLHRNGEQRRKLQAEKELAQSYALKRLQETLALKEKYSQQLEQDVSAATAELTEKNQQLIALDQQKSSFFTNISHEFRTPLTLIQEPIRKLSLGDYGKLNDKGVEITDICNRNIDRLSRLINELLLLAELESGKSQLFVQETEIIQFCRRNMSLFTHTALEKNINFEFHCPETPKTLFVDPGKLEKILANLLSNAFKYTPNGGEVSLSVRYLDEQCPINGSFVILSVADSGAGIPKNEQAKIFDRFYRSPEHNDRAIVGSGIGLALVKELAELHGGDVSVTNNSLGFGSRFDVKLPLGREHLLPREIAALAPVYAKEREQLRPQAPQQGQTVLVVEDNSDMRLFITQQLEECFDVIQAENGLDALELLQAHQIDLVLSDVMMPKMDGIELLKTIRNNVKYAHLPIILITAKAADEERLIALEASVDDFLSKPFQSQELVLKIKNLLARNAAVAPVIENKNHQDDQSAASNATFHQQYEHNQFLKDVKKHVLANISSTDLDINMLAGKLFMSRSTLQRKIMQESQLTAAQFVRNIRLEQAYEYMQNKTFRTISQAAHAVGFSHVGYFSKLYHKYCEEKAAC